MRLEDLSVAVRERSLAESHDLALLVARRHAWPLFQLLLLLAVPVTVVNAWLLSHQDPYGPGRFQLAFLLAVFEVPLVTAPLSAYLGEATFSRAPSKARALRAVFSRLGPLLLLGGAVRTLCALVLVFPLLFYPMYLVEVLVLERLPARRAWSRANLLRRGQGGPLLLAVVTLLFGFPLLATALLRLWDIVVYGASLDTDLDFWVLLDPAQSAFVWVVFWPLAALCSVMRFVGYLGTRTHQEGWDVELALKRAALRLEEGRGT